MKINIIRFLFLAIFFCAIGTHADAQKKTQRKSQKRTTGTKTKTKVQAGKTGTAGGGEPTPPPEPVNDSLPVKIVKPSLRPDEAVETSALRDRTPMPYEHLRSDDAAYRHRIWREIDTREKMNQSFRYAADADNGNQMFISILLQALQDSTVTAFADERFTTPMSKSEIAKALGAEMIEVPDFDSVGNQLPNKKVKRDVPLDSFYRFRIKEEVIFDKESSRLFWRILGISPVRKVRNSADVEIGDAEVFWIYYPDMRPIFAKYEVYNPKNYGGRMSWEELFEGRMFSGRIYKSSMDNPYDKELKNIDGLQNKPLHQLYEGENIKEKIFNYEQDLWSY